MQTSRRIKNFSDGSNIEFDKGTFDNWCIFLSRPGKLRYAPRDEEYFKFFQNMAQLFSSEKIYEDFVDIYYCTSAFIDGRILKFITEISNSYENYAIQTDIWFSTIYAGMVAEENKEFAKLGKRIKRLGFHQVLIEGISPLIASKFSRGKSWQKLDLICRERGF